MCCYDLSYKMKSMFMVFEVFRISVCIGFCLFLRHMCIAETFENSIIKKEFVLATN